MNTAEAHWRLACGERHLLHCLSGGQKQRVAIAREVADQVVFMRDGIVVESGAAKEVIDNPKQSATKSFFARFHDVTSRPGAALIDDR